MEDTPLVCTLTNADYHDRERAWLKLRPFVRAFASVPGGLSFTFSPATGLEDSLTELVRLEAECCAWMTFAMSETPEEVHLTITSNSVDGERGVRDGFAPLARS